MAGEMIRINPPAAVNGQACAVPAVATAATQTLGSSTVNATAPCVGSVAWSYSDTPQAGSNLLLSDGAITFKVYITSPGPGFILFNPPKRFTCGGTVTATLSNGGGSVSGTVDMNAFAG